MGEHIFYGNVISKNNKLKIKAKCKGQSADCQLKLLNTFVELRDLIRFIVKVQLKLQNLPI